MKITASLQYDQTHLMTQITLVHVEVAALATVNAAMGSAAPGSAFAAQVMSIALEQTKLIASR